MYKNNNVINIYHKKIRYNKKVKKGTDQASIVLKEINNFKKKTEYFTLPYLHLLNLASRTIFLLN